MAKNSPEGNKIRAERYRKNHPDRIKAATRRDRDKKLALVEEYKSSGCSVCGYDRCTQALDLHHLDSSTKEETVSNLIYRRGIKYVEAELKKCVVLCANCHREHHAGLLDL